MLVACAEKSIEVAPANGGACDRPETGCACAPGSSPVACFEPDELGADGEVLCSEGTRRCESGRWSECRDVRSYRADARALARGTALVDPNASPRTCSICDVQCFEVTDPLLSADGGPDSSVTYAPGGGLTLAEGVAGPSMGPSGPVRTGCVGLDDCCDTLIAVPSLRSACQAANTGVDALCDDAHRLFCSDVTLAAVTPCVAGANPLDTDCDGIPDLVDECTPADFSAAACDGRFLPLPTPNTNPAIFHVLDIGRSANDPLQIEFKLRNADVYFLLDTSDTMSEERDELVRSLTGTRVADCALLKNCCAPLSGSAKSKCDLRVEADDQGACLADQAKYCTAP
ncbi:MAG TPA: hypothetical protein VK509_25540, partial [Polyangiales bacterium]|nr:hypothetical protein [Polyangiales bacterium]